MLRNFNAMRLVSFVAAAGEVFLAFVVVFRAVQVSATAPPSPMPAASRLPRDDVITHHHDDISVKS